MMHDIEKITKKLPGLDCGSCGAPTCMAFAEDIVKNETEIGECTVMLKRYLKEQGIHQESFGFELDELLTRKDGKEGTDDDCK